MKSTRPPAARTENLKRAQADCLCARFEFGIESTRTVIARVVGQILGVVVVELAFRLDADGWQRHAADDCTREFVALLAARDEALRHHHAITTRSEEHTSELQSLMRISYAVFCLKKKKKQYRLNQKTQN